jgi:hypothetical protein
VQDNFTSGALLSVVQYSRIDLMYGPWSLSVHPLWATSCNFHFTDLILCTAHWLCLSVFLFHVSLCDALLHDACSLCWVPSNAKNILFVLVVQEMFCYTLFYLYFTPWRVKLLNAVVKHTHTHTHTHRHASTENKLLIRLQNGYKIIAYVSSQVN